MGVTKHLITWVILQVLLLEKMVEIGKVPYFVGHSSSGINPQESRPLPKFVGLMVETSHPQNTWMSQEVSKRLGTGL